MANPAISLRSASRFFLGAALPAVLLAGATLLPGGARPASADEAPKVSLRWSLTMKHSPLRIVMVDDGSGRQSSYHYMLITVENKTALPRPWNPHVVGRTDTNRTYVAGGYKLAVEEIRRKEGLTTLLPVEESAASLADPKGKIAAGGTLTTVAVFGPVDALYDFFTIEIQGLVQPATTLRVLKYGENKEVVVEAAYADRNEKVMEELKKEAGGGELPRPAVEYREVVERRAWVVEYKRLGDEFLTDDDPIEFIKEGWVILGTPTIIRSITAAGG